MSPSRSKIILRENETEKGQRTQRACPSWKEPRTKQGKGKKNKQRKEKMISNYLITTKKEFFSYV